MDNKRVPVLYITILRFHTSHDNIHVTVYLHLVLLAYLHNVLQCITIDTVYVGTWIGNGVVYGPIYGNM